jgi:hypothetical protein
MNSASLCSLAGRYENPIPPRCLAPIDFLKIPARIPDPNFSIPDQKDPGSASKNLNSKTVFKFSNKRFERFFPDPEVKTAPDPEQSPTRVF